MFDFFWSASAPHIWSRSEALSYISFYNIRTQDVVWDEKDIAFVSLHQYPFYPGTGSNTECGAHGNILNLPLPGTYFSLDTIDI
mmetsp:Transcript_9604/g.11960  ORF Transcript_9604/g.11960 Transcript_9604/m.11960 type:complete len:84 (+) Transcript_9604:210-461(+)